ncbi:MAG: dynamin family protein, partial [Desulfobacteraceae bacterium]
MSQLIQISKESLAQVVSALSNTPWEKEANTRVKNIRAELQAPCLVAVCGEARAGKSTFINAFLGVDLAKTGVTETTSTLTYFKYSSNEKNGTVICHWTNGKKSTENMEFVYALQGHDESMMKKAATISHIEIYINSPVLKNITLVDTPGSGSLVSTHERNSKLLLPQFDNESEHLTQKADAIIYLLGHVGKLTDSEFIKEFRGPVSRVINPMNAIGVMSKIDRSINILKNRWRFADDLLNTLPDLNAVIPVSALLEKTVRRLASEGKLQILQKWLHHIPRETCEELLEEREFFDED